MKKIKTIPIHWNILLTFFTLQVEPFFLSFLREDFLKLKIDSGMFFLFTLQLQHGLTSEHLFLKSMFVRKRQIIWKVLWFVT